VSALASCPPRLESGPICRAFASSLVVACTFMGWTWDEPTLREASFVTNVARTRQAH